MRPYAQKVTAEIYPVQLIVRCVHSVLNDYAESNGRHDVAKDNGT